MSGVTRTVALLATVTTLALWAAPAPACQWIPAFARVTPCYAAADKPGTHTGRDREDRACSDAKS